MRGPRWRARLEASVARMPATAKMLRSLEGE